MKFFLDLMKCIFLNEEYLWFTTKSFWVYNFCWLIFASCFIGIFLFFAMIHVSALQFFLSFCFFFESLFSGKEISSLKISIETPKGFRRWKNMASYLVIEPQYWWTRRNVPFEKACYKPSDLPHSWTGDLQTKLCS